MNPLHYPDHDHCMMLREIDFPETALYFNRGQIVTRNSVENTWHTFDVCPCPSLMELIDRIPGHLTMTREDIDVLDVTNTVWYTRGQAGGSLPNCLVDLLVYLVKNRGLSFSK